MYIYYNRRRISRSIRYLNTNRSIQVIYRSIICREKRSKTVEVTIKCSLEQCRLAFVRQTSRIRRSSNFFQRRFLCSFNRRETMKCISITKVILIRDYSLYEKNNILTTSLCSYHELSPPNQEKKIDSTDRGNGKKSVWKLSFHNGMRKRERINLVFTVVLEQWGEKNGKLIG